MQRTKLNILYVEDDPNDIELFRRFLRNVPGYEIELQTCNGTEQDCKPDSLTGMDLFFVDYQLGPITGLDFFEKIRSHSPHTPTIMLTGRGDEKLAVEAMKAGLSDYIVKSDLSTDCLTKVIRNALKQFELEEKIRQQQAELIQMATRDGLTNLLNRKTFYDRFETEFNRAKRYDLCLCCLIIDIDHFKTINDTYGHLTGDSVLILFANLLKEVARNTDIVGRFGGEEFIIGVTNTGLDGAMDLAERIREKIEEYDIVTDNQHRLQITCSIGVSKILDTDKVEDLIKRADQSMYAAKKQGRNTVKLK